MPFLNFIITLYAIYNFKYHFLCIKLIFKFSSSIIIYLYRITFSFYFITWPFYSPPFIFVFSFNFSAISIDFSDFVLYNPC